MDVVLPPNSPATASAAALVTLSGVCRSFSLGHTTIRALRNVDLTIEQGEMVAVWGPSGSGKSSLMNIVGLIDRPDNGTLRFDGSDVYALNDNRLSDYRSKHVGFVFQSFNLAPVLTVLENVMLPLQIQGVAASYARRKANDLLELVGLQQHLRFRPDRLSGGQRQRTAIARALIADPKLVIADEPTASLDSENSHNVIDLMRSLNRKTGTTFLFATHDQRLLDHIPRTILLKDGAIEQDLQGKTK